MPLAPFAACRPVRRPCLLAATGFGGKVMYNKRGDEKMELLEIRDLSDEELEELVKGLGDDDRLELELMALQRIAGQEDSERGFAAFYRLVMGNELPEHAKKWVRDIYEAGREGYDGNVIFAFRGSWKSTTISVAYTAYQVGLYPERTNVVISCNDDTADKITLAIAKMIETNPVWKSVFGHVVPDKEMGWGAEGYWVKDMRMGYEEWTAKQSKVIDPTLVGGGVGSSRLIGKHPTGVLNLDDIHDEKNSSSARERASVVKIVSDTILPMAVKEVREGRRKLLTKILVVGTPWDEDDSYHYLKATGQFRFTSVPLMVRGEGQYFEGRRKDGLVYNDMIGDWIITWPEMYNEEAVMAERAKAGLRGFSRMFLLDLRASKQNGLRYYSYPHKDIDVNKWPLYGGVDFATVLKKGKIDDPGRDYFSMAYGGKDAQNRLVVWDGIFEQCTQAQAEAHMKKPQTLFRNWQYTIIEGDGVGEQFWIGLTSRNPGLRVLMDKTKGKSKRYRQEKELGVWLERGMILISDADTPYLNELRKALDDFPDGNNDIRDGLYWLAKSCPEVMVEPRGEEPIKTFGRVAQVSPLASVGLVGRR
jgi:hypothetical protein